MACAGGVGAFGIVKHLQLVSLEDSNQFLDLDRLSLTAGASPVCRYGERLERLRSGLRSTRNTDRNASNEHAARDERSQKNQQLPINVDSCLSGLKDIPGL